MIWPQADCCPLPPPQVEHVLFPELQGLALQLPSVGLEEGVVRRAREQALRMLQANLVGPHQSALPRQQLLRWPLLSIMSLPPGTCQQPTTSMAPSWMARPGERWRPSFSLMQSSPPLARCAQRCRHQGNSVAARLLGGGDSSGCLHILIPSPPPADHLPACLQWRAGGIEEVSAAESAAPQMW